MATRNSQVLADFVRYCEEHPQERFWQAIRNWSGWPFVYVSESLPEGGHGLYMKDTFYWEGKDYRDAS